MVFVYLTPDDYHVQRDGNLCNNIPNFSFVMFTSEQCRHCKDVEPDFLRLSRSIQGCSFGIMNVDQYNQKIVTISARSNTPLEYVPYIILYRHGVPVAQYVPDESKPSSNFDSMKAFIIAYTTGNGSRQFGAQQNRTQQPEQPMKPAIPAYSIGIPGNLASDKSSCHNKVCYLGFDNAYKNGKK